MTFLPRAGLGADNSASAPDITNSLLMRQMGSTVSPKDVSAALQPYGLSSYVAKGKSDQQLHDQAVRSVIAWWKRQKADASKSGGGTGSNTGSAGSGKGSSGGAAAGSGSQGSGSGFHLPNTAFGAGGQTNNLPDILTTAEKQQKASSAVKASTATAIQNKPKFDAKAILNRYGMGNLTPPAYALVSSTSLVQWIQRIQRNQAAARAASARKVAPQRTSSGTTLYRPPAATSGFRAGM